MLILLASLCFSSRQLPAPTPSPLIGARSLALSPDGKRLSFSYQGDIWVSSADGGRAVPLTDNIEMDDNPVWSPDGKYIAFSSNRTGNWDIFVVPADGGRTQQMTWNTGSDVPSDWSPDGKYIIERTTRETPYNGLYAIDVANGRTHKLMVDMMPIGSPHYSPDGKTILYTRYGFPWVRPRYCGSGASQLWKVDLATGKRSAVWKNDFQHLWPSYLPNGDVLAVTVADKTPSSSPVGHPIPKIVDSVDRTPNVYEIGASTRRLTDFVGEGARFLTVAKKAPVAAFERDGDVYVQTIGEKPHKISITASIDDKTAQTERLVLTNGVQHASLTPKGDKLAFTIRNKIWMVPTKKEKGPNADDATQLTNFAGLDTDPLWAPDGKTLFFLSERNGPLRVFRMDSETKEITPVSKGPDVAGLRFTPDKTRISFWTDGPEGGLYTVPISGGEPTKVLGKAGEFGEGQDNAYDWSPDGRYIAYSDVLQRSGYYYWDNTTNIWIYDTKTGTSTDVTRLSASHSVPRFSPDGRYLMMRSNREGDGIYVIPLHREDAAPSEIEMKYEKPTAPVKVEIDLDNIEDRPRKLITTQAEGDFHIDPTNGDIYYIGEGGAIWKAKFDGTEPTRLGTSNVVSSFDFSDDLSKLVIVQDGQMVTMDIRHPGNPQTGIAFRADWTHDLRKEHEAAFWQFWRAYEHGFYDPNFHGRDWTALGKDYVKFLPSVGHRNEMATVLNMLVGELESSHSEVGPAAGNPKSEVSAHPGFSFDYSYEGPGIRIKDVPRGVPGSYSKTKLEAGETVTEINGKPVEIDEALWRDVLNQQVGRDIDLTVKGLNGTVRHVKYKALSSGEYGAIVSRNLYEWRRKHVEEISHGTLTYVHIAGMDQGSLNRFNQEVWEYAQGKKGLIIDVRNNGGGNTADLLVQILERRPSMMYQPRNQKAVLGPGQALAFPMVVMMAQTSYSNAEMFPAAMRARGLAKLVGMPTPGYVIYTGGFQLVDGTSARMPGTGVYQLDGTPLEDNGQMPDVEVDISPDQFFSNQDPQLDAAVAALMK